MFYQFQHFLRTIFFIQVVFCLGFVLTTTTTKIDAANNSNYNSTFDLIDSTTTISTVNLAYIEDFHNESSKPTATYLFNNIVQQLSPVLDRFNSRFVSMKQCQQTASVCQCLWNGEYLSSQLWTVPVFGNGSDDYLQTQTQRYRRQYSSLMLANVLRISELSDRIESSEEPNSSWQRCSLTENICNGLSKQKLSPTLSYYEIERVKLLSILMPNVAVNSVPHQNDSVESMHQLQYDLERLLYRLNGFLSYSNILESDSNENQTDRKNCFTQEDLLRELRSHRDEDYVDGDNNERNLLYIEYLAQFIVDHLISGKCIELFDWKFLHDIVARYGSTAEEFSPEHPQTHPNTVPHIDHKGFTKLLNDLHIGGLIERNEDTGGELSSITDNAEVSSNRSRGHRSVSSVGAGVEHNHLEHRHQHASAPWHSHNRQPIDHDHHSPSLSNDGHSTVVNSVCLDQTFYWNQLGGGGDHQHHSDRSKKRATTEDIRQLAPIFLQQILSRACEQIEPYDGSYLAHDTFTNVPEPDSEHSMRSSSKSLFRFNVTSHDDTELEMYELYLYSTLAVLAISLTSIGGVLLLPFLHTNLYSHMINLLIGLAFGSMSGDALFHLIPTVLGIHSHGHSEASPPPPPGHSHHDHEDDDHHHHSEHHSHENMDKPYLWLMLAILITVYLLFLFEVISNALAKNRKTHHHNHNHHHSHNHNHHHNNHVSDSSKQSIPKHSHHTHELHHNWHHHHHHLDVEEVMPGRELPPVPSITQSPYSSSLTIDTSVTGSMQPNKNDQSVNGGKSISTLQLNRSAYGDKNPDPSTTINHKLNQEEPNRTDNIPVFCGMTSMALIITFGDSVHNLFDGIAIGIAFSNSISSGISTSIAVLCHELPHEFGDFAVLLSTGLTVRRAALINFLSALTAFIGLYIGILLGANDTANKWALAICAGLFLYVALCDMLPELKEMEEESFTGKWFFALLVKNCGILLGYASMVILALFEDKINFV